VEITCRVYKPAIAVRIPKHARKELEAYLAGCCAVALRA
jgi:hypothetical protein